MTTATQTQPQRDSSEPELSTLDLLLQPRPQLFINFRGKELRNGFLSHVVKSLKEVGINVFIDSLERRGVDTFERLLARIDNSKMALAIFSNKYTQSDWCLNELVRMDERMKEGKLVVIPIFYRVSTEEVKNFQGKFGRNFREMVMRRFGTFDAPMAQRWMIAVTSIASKMGLTSEVYSIDSKLVEEIVKTTSRQLGHVSSANLSTIYQVTLEFYVAFFVAIFCTVFIPSAFTHVKIFSSPQWFVAHMFSFIVRKAFYWLMS
ncbi:unnamed protein product [Eruca vesicaria subsp. sativa]|uniref:TIR domain-containing protein n=1 Tax=Eruca vesicaria subsp. sativa TaxID=29727 RepID=A0ABC8K5M8_ERUVS|nr:unnamed protein product [Eruca vesicaria subsp. sativa]